MNINEEEENTNNTKDELELHIDEVSERKYYENDVDYENVTYIPIFEKNLEAPITC